jgi:hypothetical protein
VFFIETRKTLYRQKKAAEILTIGAQIESTDMISKTTHYSPLKGLSRVHTRKFRMYNVKTTLYEKGESSGAIHGDKCVKTTASVAEL